MTKFITACALWLLATAAIASDSINLSIEKWLFNEIQAEQLQFDLTLTATGIALIAKTDSLHLAEPVGTIKNIRLSCEKLLIQAQQFSCQQGLLAFTHHEFGKQNLAVEVTAQPDNDHYHLQLSGLRIADSSINIEFNWQNQAEWHAVIDSPQLQLEKLITQLSPYFSEKITNALTNWDIAGVTAVHADISGHNAQIAKVELDITSTTLDLSDSAGQYVTEQLALTLNATVEKKDKQWQWQTDIAVSDGQAYAEPVFIDVSAAPFTLQGQGEWQPEDKQLLVNQFTFSQPKVMTLSGSFSLHDAAITHADITLDKSDLAMLYQQWLQPFTTGTAVDSLEVAGQLHMHYQQTNDDYQVLLGLDDVFIDDNNHHFGIDGLSGDLAWTNTANAMTTDLSWLGGYVYAIPLGASKIQAEVLSSTLTLADTWHLPILDGTLQLNQLQVHHPDGEHATWSFDGLLTPISMESLSTALNWPLLHGKLSGVIPKVSYADQKINVDGALMVKLFEGTTVIRDLRLNKPFGTLPQLYGNIDLIGLDLETITSTFDFGKITGKLDGTVRNLRLSNWQPVQFDARFATPDGDKSRRKISQRAVDNLSQIGGGASGVLSRSFLRFFEDFSYQRLGLSCQLMNNVCQMSGVEEADNGYYIVKGGGLPPRINVVGYTRRVDWSDLIERLKAVQNSSGPVVQ